MSDVAGSGTTPGWHTLVGGWTGTDRVWFEPSTLANESAAAVVVRPTLGGRGVVIESRWTMGEDEQFTTLLLVAGADGVEGALVDTFHTGGGAMALAPVPAADRSSIVGEVEGIVLAHAAGGYDGDGERWGWHVVLRSVDHDHLVVEAHNVSPGGEASLAVRSELTRAVDPHDEVTA